MDKGIGRRVGKVVSGGHTLRVEGLNKFIEYLEEWPEITQIRLGHVECMKTASRNTKKRRTGNSGTGARARAKSGGGFTFKATRPVMVGDKVTGINCHASNGTFVQHVVLFGDLNALKARLSAEEFGAKW